MKSDKVLLSVIVSEWFFVVEPVQHQEMGFQAVMIPPLEPIAGRQWRIQDEHLRGGLINRDLEQMSKINDKITFFLQ